MSNKETPSSEEEITTCRLVASDDDLILNNNVIVEFRAEGYEEIEVKKSSEVDKSKQIRLNEDTLFEFDCLVEDEYLCLKLNEIDALSPYIYIKKIELKELQKDVHKMFKALDTLEDVKQHIDKLFKNGKIKLRQERKEEIFFDIKAYYISEEVEFSIKAEREMTDNKDNMLLKLYEIQKQLMKEKNKKKIKKSINEIIALEGNILKKNIKNKIFDLYLFIY